MTTISAQEQLKAGTHSSAARDITTSWSTSTDYTIFYDTSPWLSTDACSGQIEFSPDGGVTWGWGCANTTSGGTRTTSKGAPWGCGCSSALPGRSNWPSPDGWPANPTSVQARVTYTVPTTKTTTVTATLT